MITRISELFSQVCLAQDLSWDYSQNRGLSSLHVKAWLGVGGSVSKLVYSGGGREDKVGLTRVTLASKCLLCNGEPHSLIRTKEKARSSPRPQNIVYSHGCCLGVSVFFWLWAGGLSSSPCGPASKAVWAYSWGAGRKRSRAEIEHDGSGEGPVLGLVGRDLQGVNDLRDGNIW